MPARRVILLAGFVFLVLLGAFGLWVAFDAAPIPDDVRSFARDSVPGARESSEELVAPDAHDADTPRVEPGVREPARARPTEAPARRARLDLVSARLSGRVLDLRGAPIEDAVVELERRREPRAEGGALDGASATEGGAVLAAMEDDESNLLIEDTLTDAAGEFAFQDLLPGRWTLRSARGEFEVAELELEPLRAGEERADVVLRLVPAPRVRVRVLAPDGAPVPDADVGAWPLDDAPARSFAHRRLRAAASRQLGRESLDDPMSGRMRQSEGSTDEDGVVELALSSCRRWSVTASVARSAREFGVEGAPELALLADGRLLAWRGAVTGEGVPPPEVVVRLDLPSVLVGRVTNAQGEPVRAEASVHQSLGREDGAEFALEYAATGCDANGVFVLDHLPTTAFELHVVERGRYAAHVERVEPFRGVQRRDVVLRRLPTLTGFVRDPRSELRARATVELEHVEAVPASEPEGGRRTTIVGELRVDGFQSQRRRVATRDGVELRTRIGTATTDADGFFRFERVPIGRVELVASGTDTLASERLVLHLVGDEELRGLTLRLREGARVEGRALGPGGVALAKRILHFFPEGEDERAESALTDAEGAFRLFRLEPGRWTFQLELDDEAAEGVEPVVLSRTIDTADGAVARVTLEP
ncbi:MAG: carboxypeptidase regulatory-like domain-containing protein [Planctomycetes bacterium]|nr:carboxypeptidase regulatory-like domain-containing protein [Planctomycetota bacterium]